MTSDREALALVAPLAIAFAKHLGSVYLPPVDLKNDSTSNEADFPSLQADAGQGEGDEIVSREMKEKFRKLMVAYFEVLGKKEQKLHLVSRHHHDDAFFH